jgi:hypothetical protein
VTFNSSQICQYISVVCWYSYLLKKEMVLHICVHAHVSRAPYTPHTGTHYIH